MIMSENKNSRLAFLLPFRCIVFVLIFVIGAAVTGKKTEELSNWWSIAATVVNIVTVLMLFAAARHLGGYRKLMNLYRGDSSKKKIFLQALIYSGIGMSGMYLAGFVCYGSMLPAVTVEYVIPPVPAAVAVINLILLPLTVSFAEDGLYLGCGVNSFKNKYAAVIIPAFFYALQHCFIPTIFDVKYMLYRFLSFLPLTVIFCIVYRRKKDPLAIMISHAVLDLGTAVMILLTSVSPELYQKWYDMV